MAKFLAWLSQQPLEFAVLLRSGRAGFRFAPKQDDSVFGEILVRGVNLYIIYPEDIPIMIGTRIGATLALLSIILVSPAGNPARSAEIVITTGEAGGRFHQVGRAICHFLSRTSKNLACLPLPITAGDTTESVANLNNVQSGAVELGLAHADSQFHAVRQSGPFKFMDTPFDNLRSVFSLHTYVFTLLAHKKSGIRSMDDLKGHRINIGSPRSTQRQLIQQALKAKGWTKDNFSLVEELPAAQQSLAFCHGRLDAIVYVVVHPDATINRVANLCDAMVVPVKGPKIDKLIQETAYYSFATVPGGTYAHNAAPIPTFGVTTTLVSSSDVDPDTIYSIVKTVFENFESFKTLHTAFSDLEQARMVSEGLTAPLHDGALRYYREMGMM